MAAVETWMKKAQTICAKAKQLAEFAEQLCTLESMLESLDDFKWQSNDVPRGGQFELLWVRNCFQNCENAKIMDNLVSIVTDLCKA